MTDSSRCSARIEFKLSGKTTDNQIEELVKAADLDNLRVDWESGEDLDALRSAMVEGRIHGSEITLVSRHAMFGQFSSFEPELNAQHVPWRRVVEADNSGAATQPGVTYSPRKPRKSSSAKPVP